MNISSKAKPSTPGAALSLVTGEEREKGEAALLQLSADLCIAIFSG